MMRMALLVAMCAAGCTTGEPDECDPPIGYYVARVDGVATWNTTECASTHGTDAIGPGNVRLTWFVDAPTVEDWRCTGAAAVSASSCAVDLDSTCCTPDATHDCYDFRGVLERPASSRRPNRTDDAFEGSIEVAYHADGAAAECVAVEHVRIEAAP